MLTGDVKPCIMASFEKRSRDADLSSEEGFYPDAIVSGKEPVCVREACCIMHGL
jgi:hypothetical protein